MGADVWRGNKAPSERGLVVLGTPIGHPHFMASWAESRMRTEQELLSQLPRLPELQCAWLLLVMCASPRANHALRTVPPLDIAGYAQAHDDVVRQTLQACLGGVASGEVDGAQPWQLSQRRKAGWVERARSVPRPLRTGRRGLMHSLSLADAAVRNGEAEGRSQKGRRLCCGHRW